jgi:hypothetical protein
MQTNTPTPDGAMSRVHPAEADRIILDIAARQDGWDSHTEKQDALIVLRRWARVVAEQRAAVNDPCLVPLDIADGLEDRIGTGHILLPHVPTRWNAAAVLCHIAAQLEWPHIKRAQEEAAYREAEEMAAEQDAANAIRIRELLGADERPLERRAGDRQKGDDFAVRALAMLRQREVA